MRFTVSMPDLGKVLAGTEKEMEKAVTAGMRDATAGLKQALRDDIVSAGLGERLAKTWRGKTFPETGESIEAAAYVWSKAPKIIDAFDRGVVIRSKDGFWLAIPTPAASKSGIGLDGARKRITPGGWERRTGMRLRFVYRRGKPSLLVAENIRIDSRGRAQANKRKSREASAVIFILVAQVSLRKRLDIDSAAKRQAARVPSLIARHWKPS